MYHWKLRFLNPYFPYCYFKIIIIMWLVNMFGGYASSQLLISDVFRELRCWFLPCYRFRPPWSSLLIFSLDSLSWHSLLIFSLDLPPILFYFIFSLKYILPHSVPRNMGLMKARSFHFYGSSISSWTSPASVLCLLSFASYRQLSIWHNIRHPWCRIHPTLWT